MNSRRLHKRSFSKKSAPTETLTLRMERMAQGGDAISHLEDGRVCFVSGALTGELAEVILTQNKKDYAKGFAKKILEKSAFRREPQCPFYGKCGGCSMEHATLEFQLETYRASVEDLFRRFAKTELPKGWKIHSGKPYGYRNRARLVRAGDGWGFRETQSHHVIPVSKCEVLTPALNKALADNAFPNVPELSVFDNGNGKISYYYKGMAPADFKKFAMNSVQIGDAKISMDSACFFQSNLEVLPELVETVKKAAGTGEYLIDLFSGVGFFATVLQKNFKKIVTVEREPKALFHADQNVPDAHNVSSPAEDWLAQNDASGADVLIVDPPRTGLPPSALEAIAKAAPKKLIYVSCDPATLARDYKQLSENFGYKMMNAEGFAFYPQTPHFEMFLELKRV